MSKNKKEDIRLYDPADYHQVECFVSRELYNMYSTETLTGRMILKSIRIELMEDKIKIIYDTWEQEEQC